MKLKKVLKDIPGLTIKGSKEIDITGICSHSKTVAPGNLFIAKKGRLQDGVKYIPEAIAAGATAILTDIFDPTLKNITQLICADVSLVEAVLAAHYYQFPTSELFTVGITGTNGKTTTSFLIKHLLDQFYGPCGVIGTVECHVGQQTYQSKLTTPDVVTNHKMCREMVMNGCRSIVMEVTSHALDQGRVRFMDYDIAIFTNLTQDHLDYHKTMEEYGAAKNKLFYTLHLEPLVPKKFPFSKLAIVNADDPWHKQITEGCHVPVMTYGIHEKCDVHAKNIKIMAHGTTFDCVYANQVFPCSMPLVGRFNVYNALAAISVALARKIPLHHIVKAIASFPAVSGRLEPVPNPLDLKIYVDFAHSDDSLKNILKTLTELKTGRIITVFGCGGDRDKTKRPKMARAAEEFSDLCIVTSDNPRTENPNSIIQDIIQGFTKQTSYIIEMDRYKAIEKAINIANKEDIILIAGKGHEAYQIFAQQTIPFDDRKVAHQICTQGLKRP